MRVKIMTYNNNTKKHDNKKFPDSTNKHHFVWTSNKPKKCTYLLTCGNDGCKHRVTNNSHVNLKKKFYSKIKVIVTIPQLHLSPATVHNKAQDNFFPILHINPRLLRTINFIIKQGLI